MRRSQPTSGGPWPGAQRGIAQDERGVKALQLERQKTEAANKKAFTQEAALKALRQELDERHRQHEMLEAKLTGVQAAATAVSFEQGQRIDELVRETSRLSEDCASGQAASAFRTHELEARLRESEASRQAEREVSEHRDQAAVRERAEQRDAWGRLLEGHVEMLRLERERAGAFQAQHAQAVAQVAEATARVSTEAEARGRLERRLVQLQDAFEQATTSNAELTRESADVRRQCDDLAGVTKQLQHALRKTTQQCKALSQVNGQLAVATRRLEVLEKELSAKQSKATLNEKEGSIAISTTNTASSVPLLNHNTIAENELAARLLGLERDLAAQRAGEQELRLSLAVKEKMLEDQAASIGGLKGKLMQVTKERDEANEDAAALEVELDEARAEIDDLHAQLDAKSVVLAELRGYVRELRLSHSDEQEEEEEEEEDAFDEEEEEEAEEKEQEH